MKTLRDLMELSVKQEELNNNKLVKYHLTLDMHYKWATMKRVINTDDAKEECIFQLLSFATPEQLQEVFWRAYNVGRK